jgi:hypothetical protein
MRQIVRRFSPAYIFLGILSVLGGLYQFFLSAHFPLWLDEKYSLFFAKTFSYRELLINSPDSHPGGFYALLKFALMLTQQKELLRFALSCLPIVLGAFLVSSWLFYRRRSLLLSVSVLAFLFFHTLMSDLGVELRMYGVSIGLGCLLAIFGQRFWEKKQWRDGVLITGLLLLGNIFSYSFFFISAGFLLGLPFLLEQKKRFITFVGLSLLFGAEFLVLAGVSTKQKFEQASSWIPVPSFSELTKFVLTSLGIEYRIQINATVLIALGVVFFSVGVFFLYRYLSFFQKFKHIVFHQYFLLMILFPSLLIIGVSFAFPILSQRFFFYHFIPKLSLFLPRVFTPIFVMAGVWILQLVAQHQFPVWLNKRFVGTVFLFAVSLVWLRSTLNIYQRKMIDEKIESTITHLVDGQSPNASPYFLPSWSAITAIRLNSLEKISENQRLLHQSEKLEQKLFSAQNFDCAELPHGQVTSTGYVSPSIAQYYVDGEKKLDTCCTKIDHQPYKTWQCQ